MQPSESVTVSMYSPSFNPDILCVVSPLLQLYSYPDVPPIGDTVINPLESPLQTGCSRVTLLRSRTAGSVKSVETSTLHPLKSEMVVTYVPAPRLNRLSF